MSDREGKAIQFIEFVPKKGFTVTKEAIEFLSTLANEQLGVVAIAGKYRTGKSFLVNRILLDQKEGGFGVGSTIKACTKGLWMWDRVVPSENPDFPHLKLLIIDTEGFGGIEENQNHDSKIFLLAILLSSYFIYNSMGTIDETALQSLNLVINMAKEVRLTEDGGELNEEDIAMNFPSFLWIVRDFALKLVNAEGVKLSSPEYLETCLQPVKGISENVENKNKVRRLLKFFFQDRDCVTVVRPAESEEEIQSLNLVESSQFRKEFHEQMLRTKSKIFRKARPKKFNHRILTGPMLLELAQSYASVLNSGKTPSIQGAWTYLMESENERAANQAICEVEDFVRNVRDDGFFKDKHWKDKLMARARQTFTSKALGDSEEKKEFEEKLLEELSKRLDSTYSKKVAEQRGGVKKWIASKGLELMDHLKQKKTTSYKECEEHLDQLVKEFRREYDHLPADMLDSIATEWRAEQQGELFGWVEMEAVQQQKLEKHAMELRIKHANEEKDRLARLAEMQMTDMQEKLKKLEFEGVRGQERLEDAQRETGEYREMFERSEKVMKELQREIREKEQNSRHELAVLQEKFTNETEFIKKDFFIERSELEKRISLLEQELTFKNKEIKDLEKQLAYERQEKKRYSQDIDELKEKLNSKKDLNIDEIIIKQDDYTTMESTIQGQFESIKQLESRYSEERLNRQLAENRIQLLEEKLSENKNMSEIIIDNLRSQIRNEDLNRSEISHLKKLTENEADNKVKKLEGNLEKLKMFKFIFKYAQTIQCAICNRFFSSAMFLDHVLSELPPDQNPFQEKDVSVLRGLDEKEERSKLQAITVTISQTMVREENAKGGSSYTEYVVQVRTDTCNWNVSRRYKAFCELHNALVSSFPYVKFPSVAKDIFGTKDNLTKMLNTRKPTVIEERRLNLQSYLRETLKVDVLCNSRILREFLDIDKYYDHQNYLKVLKVRESKSPSSYTGMIPTADAGDLVRGNLNLLPRGTSHSEMIYDDNMSPEEKQKYFLRKLNKDMNKR
jgi:uncharacterized coiled-coil protein SlyX